MVTIDANGSTKKSRPVLDECEPYDDELSDDEDFGPVPTSSLQMLMRKAMEIDKILDDSKDEVRSMEARDTWPKATSNETTTQHWHIPTKLDMIMEEEEEVGSVPSASANDNDNCAKSSHAAVKSEDGITEERHRNFVWNHHFYVDQTNSLAIVRDYIDARDRQAGIRLQQCRWMRLRCSPFWKKAGVPTLTLTTPEGDNYFVDDLSYYADQKWADYDDEEDEENGENEE